MKEHIERMKAEKAELETKITKLHAFMESEEFTKLDNVDKKLLRQQYAGMETYLTSLTARLLRDDIKRYQDDINKLNKEISELKLQGKSDEEVTKIISEKMKEINSIGDGVDSIILSGMFSSETNICQ
jgi:chromosome segregation ATPase